MDRGKSQGRMPGPGHREGSSSLEAKVSREQHG